MSQFRRIVAAKSRMALPALSEIPDAALANPLPFKIVSESESRKGEVVLNGLVKYEGTVYRAAIYGMGAILEALGDRDAAEGLVLELQFERSAKGFVNFARMDLGSDAVAPAEAEAAW